MKKEKQPVCPCCSRHCTMDCIRCKHGRAYFAKFQQSSPAIQPESKQKPKHKWERDVAMGGLMWHLLSTSRRIKKALHRRSTSESCLMNALSEAERNQLLDMLRKMNGCLE